MLNSKFFCCFLLIYLRPISFNTCIGDKYARIPYTSHSVTISRTCLPAFRCFSSHRDGGRRV